MNQLTHGGRLLENGVERELGPVRYLIALLARRCEPLAEEIAMRSAFEFLNFQRIELEKRRMSYSHDLMFCGFVPGNVRGLTWQSLAYALYCFVR